MSTNPEAQNQQMPQYPPFKPRSGPHPSIQASSGQTREGGFRPAQVHSNTRGAAPPMRIMTNPSRGRGNGPINANPNGSTNTKAWSNSNGLPNKIKSQTGTNPSSLNNEKRIDDEDMNESPVNGAVHQAKDEAEASQSTHTNISPNQSQTQSVPQHNNSQNTPRPFRGGFSPSNRGGQPPIRGAIGFKPAFRGRGFNPAFNRGRGDFGHRGGPGFRGRGRGTYQNQPVPAVSSN